MVQLRKGFDNKDEEKQVTPSHDFNHIERTTLRKVCSLYITEKSLSLPSPSRSLVQQRIYKRKIQMRNRVCRHGIHIHEMDGDECLHL